MLFSFNVMADQCIESGIWQRPIVALGISMSLSIRLCCAVDKLIKLGMYLGPKSYFKCSTWQAFELHQMNSIIASPFHLTHGIIESAQS